MLLAGTYAVQSNYGSFIPALKFLSLTGYNKDCNSDSLATPSIDCSGTWLSLMFQHIKCLHVSNCVVFTGHDTTVEVDHVTFHDSLIRLASITAADHSELDYNYTLGSHSYCLLQKQLADNDALVQRNSVLGLRNVSFSSDYLTTCSREYGIQLATIHATDSALDIADCLFTQNDITHISLLHSTLYTSGMIQFENGNTAIRINNSTLALTGTVNFYNKKNSAIQAVGTHSNILLTGTVEFTNNTGNSGGAISMLGGNITITYNAHVVFQGNHAKTYGGAIDSLQHVTIAGSVQFINNSAYQGGAVDCEGSVTIADNAQVVFQGNNAKIPGGAIASGQHVTIAGSVQFVNNSADQGGAIASAGDVSIADNAQVGFQGNLAKTNGGAIDSDHSVSIAGSVQFINNSADQGGAIDSDGNVTIADNAQVVFQGNHAKTNGGAIASGQHVTIAGSVQFTCNIADQGGTIDSDGSVIIKDNAKVVFQGNHATTNGGAIDSLQHVTIAGSVQFINNSADQLHGGAIACDGNVTTANNAQVVFQGNHAKTNGGAIASGQHVTIAGSVQFINNSADQGGAIDSDGNVIIADNAQVFFQGSVAKTNGGAIATHQHVTIAGSVQFINNSADQLHGGAIACDGNVTTANNAQVVFQGNHAKTNGGAIDSLQHVTIAGSVQFINNSADVIDFYGNAQVIFQGNDTKTNGGAIASHQHVTIAGSVQFINNSADQGGAVDSNSNVTIADNAQVVFQDNHAKTNGGAIDSLQHVTIAGSVQFINNSADQGGAIDSDRSVTIADNAQVVFQGNAAKTNGGAIFSSQHITIAGSAHFINNIADQAGSIASDGNVTIADNAQVVFQGNHAKTNGGAIASHHSVTIAGSAQFINNSADEGGAVESVGNVTIADNAQVVFEGNHAKTNGGAIASHQLTIAGSVMFINNIADQAGAINSVGNATIADNAQVVFQGNHAKRLGGAITSSQHVTIAGSVQFINNSADQGGAIDSNGNVTIEDNAKVIFQGNHAKLLGGSIWSNQHTTIAGSVQFINNSANQAGAITSVGGVTTAGNAQVTFQGNHADSIGGAIVTDSNIVLAGNVQFSNNTAQLGGAISMIPGSMTVANNAQVFFQGNRAYHVGGAIYSSASTLVYYVLQNAPCMISFGVNSTMDLLHNTAERGGSAMYGITMSKLECNIETDVDYNYLFNTITIIPDSFSAVSSDPLRVCICPDQSTPDCLAILPDQNIPHLHYTVYPGQNFTIPVAVVGFNFALTSGAVYIQILSSDASLGSESQYVQGVNQSGCSQLQYSVLSGKKQETLVLTANGRQVGDIDSSVKEDIRIQNNNSVTLYNYFPLSNQNKYYANHTFMTNLTDGVFRLAGYVQVPLQSTPVYVSVQLLDCPLGFTLTGQQRCDCNERILTNLLTCNITDQTVSRHGNIWVNASFSGDTSNGVIVHKHCPFEYCKPEQLDVNLTHPETQCAFDHYGTLCGACKPNFSLALGGSQCLPNCSNKYLLLLIVFILAGFALVFFIKILNLTVSQGTLNGLIFYANIVAANRSILFPAQYNRVLSFLSVFISWLNLDLGIETCFIMGLDGYQKIWLQFVFPFYVWLIVAAIILVSHYSSRATTIFGDNSVSVLATLFLLSYTKLLRSIITIFSFTTLEYPDNTTAKVWSYDGNIWYLSSKHIPLFLFALAIVLLLWLPYTAVLLSARCLRTQTHRKGLRWLKPFLDAYYGPFKDKHHYWVGVLLVVRGVIFVFFASFLAIENNVNLLLISITSLTILLYTSFTGRLYKKVYATVLENLYFLNLGVLGIGTYHIRVLVVGGSQEALVTTSVGIAFLEFCGITIFHSYQNLIGPIQKWYAYVKVRANDGSIDNTVQLQPLLNPDSSSDDDDSLEYMPRNEVTHSEIRLSQLREEQDPPNPTTSAEHQLSLADRNNTRHSEEILIPFNRDTPLHNTSQVNYSGQIKTNCRVDINENTTRLLIPLTHDTPVPNIHPTQLSDAAANEAAVAPSQSEAAAVSLDQPPLPQESSEPPRYFAAEREERFIDFIAPRETLLEYIPSTDFPKRGMSQAETPLLRESF